MAPTAREVLNELRWRSPDRLGEAVLWYRDRMRPEGARVIRGSDIVDLERRYFTTASEGRLPYYKIERIEVAGRAIFVRPAR
ncbi:MAG TPA: RNA repair domain-containing protein [Thermoplasmata archaeon]|nr:RNA repair domain-containing protein [Thermoplasmata archaeon]